MTTKTTTLDFHAAATLGHRLARFADDYTSVWGPTVKEAWKNSKAPTRKNLLSS
jgi:hypothetical protein